MIKILIIVSYFSGASDSMPNREALFSSLRRHHHEVAHVQNTEILRGAKRDWLHWLPSVGVQFGQPTISFSLGKVIDNLERKEERAAKSRSILRGANLNFRVDSIALEMQLRKIEILKTSIQYDDIFERNDSTLFEIVKAKWRANEITPSVWYQEMNDYLNKAQVRDTRRQTLELEKLKALEMAKY